MILNATNTRTGISGEVIVWGNRNGGCTGDAHGRFNVTHSAGQWKTGAAACVLWTGVPLMAVVDACGGIERDAVFMTSAGVDHEPTGLDAKKAMVER